ncbi:hypothetical protein BKA62DRAFT_707609 [Auriculariales sp. MPI-PUGE-AT-0066]|nr:hypothetical protein BKA62DRAFT_707609 [Auriculariales sp. MPI-PUGE-AT-0066]
MRASIVLRAVIASLASSTACGKLLVDFKGGDEPSKLGAIELESFNLGDRIPAGQGGDDVFIKNEEDSDLGMPSLHYKRSAHYRRAEMRILDHDIQEGQTYYVGFKFRLAHSRKGLAIFQWKKADKVAAPAQNIPIDLVHSGNDQLTLEYTTPGGNGSDRSPVWHGPLSSGSGKENVHSVALAINTDNSGKGWLEFYLDGKKQKFDNGEERLKDVYLFTGRTYPKIGIYRGESAQGDESNPEDHTFNSYLYRAQISDTSLDEIAEAGGLNASQPEEPTPTGSPEPTSTPLPTSDPPTPTPTSSPEPKPTCKRSRRSSSSKRSRRSRHRV